MSARIRLSAVILLMGATTSGCSAQNVLKQSKMAEKIWAVTHPFIASGVIRHTNKALEEIRNARGRYGLDSALAEGSFDAFRHAYWMASLSRHYKPEKVLKLGRAHEKSNYRSFLRQETENGIIPDKTNSDMDLWNNERGAEIGYKHRSVSKDSLRNLVIQELAAGKLKVIRRDHQGRYLDCSGNVIPSEKLKGTWENPKCLSPSYLK